MKVAWSDLNNVQEAGCYPFRDGSISVLETEIAVWRGHPNALFNLMRKNPIRVRLNTFLGNTSCPAKTRPDDKFLKWIGRCRPVALQEC
jgi:hypothetical protein